MREYNWRLVFAKARVALREKRCRPSIRGIAEYLDIPRSTLGEAFQNHGITVSDLPNMNFPDDVNENVSIWEDDGFDDGEKERLITTQDGDTLEVDYRGKGFPRLTTLEGLIEFCEVDTEIWEVERWVANKWEVGAKNAMKKLVVEPLFQIKAWFKRKKPLEEAVTINAINLNLNGGSYKKRKQKVRGQKQALIIPDIQFGFSRDMITGEMITFHDRSALDVALQIAEHIGHFDRVIYIGDVLDLAEWSTHFRRPPDQQQTSQHALIEAVWWMTQFRNALPDAETDLIEGNHEDRINTSIIENLPAAYTIKAPDEMDRPFALSVERMLALESLGINYIDNYPNGEIWLNDWIKCIHGNTARKGPGATSRAIIDNSSVSVIQGHSHRLELVSQIVRNKDNHHIIHGLNAGCLCKLDGTVPGSTKDSEWQQGLAIIYYDETPIHTIVPIPINNGLANFDGYLFKASSRVKDIRHDTGFGF